MNTCSIGLRISGFVLRGKSTEQLNWSPCNPNEQTNKQAESFIINANKNTLLFLYR